MIVPGKDGVAQGGRAGKGWVQRRETDRHNQLDCTKTQKKHYQIMRMHEVLTPRSGHERLSPPGSTWLLPSVSIIIGNAKTSNVAASSAAGLVI